MSTFAILMFAAIVTVSTVGYALGWNVPDQYRQRSCRGRSWRREFPAASKGEIREFLSIFVSAFAFRDRDKLKFAPSDELLQIYQSLYPSKWQPDALELETLASLVAKRYGIELADVWSDDLTLGQLFVRTWKQ